VVVKVVWCRISTFRSCLIGHFRVHSPCKSRSAVLTEVIWVVVNSPMRLGVCGDRSGRDHARSRPSACAAIGVFRDRPRLSCHGFGMSASRQWQGLGHPSFPEKPEPTRFGNTRRGCILLPGNPSELAESPLLNSYLAAECGHSLFTNDICARLVFSASLLGLGRRCGGSPWCCW